MAYTTLADFTGNTTLTAGTYFMFADVNCNSFNLTFDCSAGSIIIKRAGDYSFDFVGTINTINSSATNKVIMTVKDDDTVGETISGSSGSPTKYGGAITNVYSSGYSLNAAVTIERLDIKYANNKQVIYYTGTDAKSIKYVTFKNSDYTSAKIFQHAPTVGLAYNYFQYIQFDSTNTMTGSANLAKFLSKTYVDYIFVENANTSDYVLNQIHNDTYGVITSNSYIKIKNAGNDGISLGDARTGTHQINNCCSSFFVGATGVETKSQFNNCLFDAALTGRTNFAINRPDAIYDVYIYTRNCTFKGYSKVFFNREYGGNRETYINCLNTIFDSNTQLLNNDDLGHQTANYCGYYNNGETYWTRGANDFTADPQFGNAVTNSVIDTSNDPYSLPTGYVPTNSAYYRTGSDTYDNLSIDESIYSPNGIRQIGSNIVSPGIYYKFTKMAAVASAITLTLPKISEASQGTVTAGGITGTAAFNLPKVLAQINGSVIKQASSVITLPKITLISTGLKYHFATSTITLPKITLAASCVKVLSATSTLTLPVLTIVTNGYLKHTATSDLTLPKLSLSSIGNKYNEAISTLQLPLLSIYSIGIHYSLGSSAITLPSISLESTGYKTDIIGTANLQLPKISVQSTAHLIRFATASINLTICQFSANGHRIKTCAPISLILPKLTLVSLGNKYNEGNSSLTLPKITSTTIGEVWNIYGSSTITLPKLTLSATGLLSNNGTAHLILPNISCNSSGYLIRKVNGNIVLPKLRVLSVGHRIKNVVSQITLPKLTISSNGHRIKNVVVAITLPQLSITSNGHRIKIIAPISLTLPFITISCAGYRIPVGVEYSAYKGVLTALSDNSYLTNFVSTWRYDNLIQILRECDYPVLQVLDKGITKEEFVGYPRRKLSTLFVQVTIKLFNTNHIQLDRDLIKMQEHIKDALEKDVQLKGKANMLRIEIAEHRKIIGDVGKTIINVYVETIRFATEGRI